MPKPVARQFVAVGHDATHQSRVAFGNPTQYEKSRLNFSLAKNVEQTQGVALDPPGQIVPILAFDRRGECFHLEIIFDIDGHRIRRAHPGVARVRRSDRGRRQSLARRAHAGSL